MTEENPFEELSAVEEDERRLDENVCGRVSPGTENAWLPSRCEYELAHAGKHLGQYGETWDDDNNTNLGDYIPYFNDDPVLDPINKAKKEHLRRARRSGLQKEE